MAGVNVVSILEAEGHLVDSQILTSVFDAGIHRGVTAMTRAGPAANIQCPRER